MSPNTHINIDMTLCNGLDGSGCSGGCEISGDENCCWGRALAIKKFKKRVLHKYIFEVIFDVVVSVLSVITDIISIGLSIEKGRWVIAIVTAIPVLLPTIIFTNVYLADETQGYCKLPKNRRRKQPGSRTVSESDEQASTTSTRASTHHTTTSTTDTPLEQFHSRVDDGCSTHCGTCHMLCVSCSGCWGGMLRSICHKDQATRDNGSKMVVKSIKRLLKYLFGTFVLRYISLAWYAKAFMFGVRAYREPKKYMKMALPNSHWSYDLLVKLDFLQAALENAPQCIVQLYVLLVYSDENPVLGMLTLLFSFMDFVRVSVSVQWDIHKGPVIAPSGCYGSLWWKLMNMSSWIFLYIGRSAALALVIATADNWSTAIPVVILVFHGILFTKLFSKARYGVAAQKVFVSVFISIFFLPEFDTSELPILTQFYYAVVHIENLFFIVPWNGMNYDYCFGGFVTGNVEKPPIRPRWGDEFNASGGQENSSWIAETEAVGSSQANGRNHNCLIDPTYIVIAVPALTMIGIVMRLAASKKMSDFKKSLPPRDDRMEMEERIAGIYSKKWTSVTWDVLFKAFLKMLKNEVIPSDEDGDNKNGPNPTTTTEKPIFIISPSFSKELAISSASFLRAVCLSPEPGEGESCANLEIPNNMKTKRSMSVDAGRLPPYRPVLTGNFERVNNAYGHFLGVETDLRKRSRSQDDINGTMNYENGKRNEIQFIGESGNRGGMLEDDDDSDMTWM